MDFRRGDDCHYRRAVHDFFRESDNEITAIKVDDRDIALTKGKLNENRTYSRCSLWAGVRDAMGMPSELWPRSRVKAHFAGLTVFCLGQRRITRPVILTRRIHRRYLDGAVSGGCVTGSEGKIDPDLIGRNILGWALRSTPLTKTY